MKNSARGITLIEILIVVALIGLAVFPLLVSARQAGQLAALRSSALVFSNALQESHNSARDARSQAGWGVKYVNETSYAVVFGVPDNFSVSRSVALENGVTFKESFNAIWFVKGTGVALPQEIQMKNLLGKEYSISVNELGIVETKEGQ